MENIRSKKGFTLLELVIVMAIIAILSATFFTGFAGIKENMNRAAAMETCSAAYHQAVKNNRSDKKEAPLDNALFISKRGKKCYSYAYNNGELIQDKNKSDKRINARYFTQMGYPCVIDADATIESGRTVIIWPRSSEQVRSRALFYTEHSTGNSAYSVLPSDVDDGIVIGNLTSSNKIALSFGQEYYVTDDTASLKFYLKGVDTSSGAAQNGKIQIVFFMTTDAKWDGVDQYLGWPKVYILPNATSDIEGYLEYEIDMTAEGVDFLGNGFRSFGGIAITCYKSIDNSITFYPEAFLLKADGTPIAPPAFVSGCYEIAINQNYTSMITADGTTVNFSDAWGSVDGHAGVNAFTIRFTDYLFNVKRVVIEFSTSFVIDVDWKNYMFNIPAQNGLTDRNGRVWTELGGMAYIFTKAASNKDFTFTLYNSNDKYNVLDGLYEIPIRVGADNGSVTINSIVFEYEDDTVEEIFLAE